MTTAPVRRRRGDELRALILAAAEPMFAVRGYAATSTRDVAAAAGVTEHAIYRHFGTKAGLYEAVVLVPFVRFVEAYLAEVDAPGEADVELEDLVATFVRGFLDVLRENRQVLATVFAARLQGDPGLEQVAAGIDRQLVDAVERTRSLLARQVHDRPLDGVDPVGSWAAMVGMMLALVLHEDWLYPAGQRPSADAQAAEVVAMILHGITHRP